MKTKLQYFCILLALFAGIHQAAAQGTTAFTYQGQLRDNGTNANGTYTMIFGLYNSASGGFPVASFITTSPTLVNGLFSVNLDFGNVFTNGSARWLDITITNSTAIQTLSPRVQVLPTPYALYAASANVAASANSVASGIDITNISITNSTFAGTFTGNGNNVTNIPASAIVGLTNFINNTGTYKAAVQEATTTGLPNFNYSPGTISGIDTGILTIDGIAVQQNDSVLVKTEGVANGIYVCTTAGSQGASYVLTLRSDFNTAANIAAGDTVTVLQGVVNANTTWFLTTAGAITIGTTPLTFSSVGVTSLNGLKGNVSLVAGTNVSLFTNGNSLIIAASVPNFVGFGSSGTFVVPTNVTRIQVEMWGGGGGGGYGASGNCVQTLNGFSTTNAVILSGGGGGGGSYSKGFFNVTPGTSYAITIGQGGSGATSAGGFGGNGGTSSLGTLIIAGGGNGGGGAATSGFCNNPCGGGGGGGSNHGVNNPNNPYSNIGGGSGDSGCSDANGGTAALGGSGGQSVGGSNNPGLDADGVSASPNGNNPGGGGSGVYPNSNNSGNTNAGNGGNGFVVIYY